jgi:tetratricopeptide (TPR) repeat protein
MNRIAALLAILISTTTLYSGEPMLPAKDLIFLLIHGEAGKGANESYKIFDGVKKSIENTYEIEGRVFAYQIPNPAGALDAWVSAISDKNDEESLMLKARKACKERISWETGITDSFKLEALTPKEFVIIAHSFAGLAVRNYICSESYRGDIRMLVTLNTPNEGSEYPHILEVLETRTALKRLESIGKKALKSVDAKGDLLKSLETAYELKKTYDCAMDVIDEAERLLKKFKETRTRFLDAQKALEEASETLNPAEIIKTIQSSLDGIKKLIDTPPTINKSAIKELKSVIINNLENQFSGSIKDFYKLMKDLDSCANGNVASVLQDMQTNRAILESAFSPETFMKAFDPQKMATISGVSADYAKYYAAATCILRKPEILFQYSTNIPQLYQQINSLISYKDSFNFDPENLIAFNFNPHPATYLERLNQLKSVSLIPRILEIKKDVLTLADTKAELSNLVVAFSTGKNVVKNVKDAVNTIQGISFNTEIDSVHKIVNDVRRFRATPDISQLKAQIQKLQSCANALVSIKNFKPEFDFKLNINSTGLECQLQEALLVLPEIELALQKGYIPECSEAYKQRILHFFALLKKPELQLPKLDFSTLSNMQMASPVGLQEAMKIFGITEYVTKILDAASGLVDAYYDVTSMADEIESLVSRFTGTAGEEASGTKVEISDLISLGMMAFSVAKMLPKATENGAAQSASLNTVGKKLAKALMKELWKEIESGALLEVGFAETMRNKSAPAASDPVMASMANDGEEMKALISALPVSFRDSALNQTKYRIIATKGVITPTKDGAKALDFVCGSGGTNGMLRAQVQAEIDRMLKKAMEEVRQKIMQKVMQEVNTFSKDVQDAVAEGMKPGGKLKEKLLKVKGGEAAYTLLVEYMQEIISGVVETLGGELASKLSDLGVEALSMVADKLANLAPVQKAWENLAFLDAINPATIISIYSTVAKVANDDRGIPLIIAATYFSPLLKLGLYENGDFISTAKSQKGENVKLFQTAKDVKRTEIDLDHPLSPFAGIALLGYTMDAAALFAPDPASKETIRITKIITINLLSASVAFAKKDQLQDYFINSHNKPVFHLERPDKLDEQLFDTPSVSVQIP